MASSPLVRPVGAVSVTTGGTEIAEAVRADTMTTRAIRIEIAMETVTMVSGTRVGAAAVIEGMVAVMAMTRNTAVAISGIVVVMTRDVAIMGVVMIKSEVGKTMTAIVAAVMSESEAGKIKDMATETQVPLAEMTEVMATPAVATRGMVAAIRVAAVVMGIVATMNATVTAIAGTTATRRQTSRLSRFPSQGLPPKMNGRGHVLPRHPHSNNRRQSRRCWLGVSRLPRRRG